LTRRLKFKELAEYIKPAVSKNKQTNIENYTFSHKINRPYAAVELPTRISSAK